MLKSLIEQLQTIYDEVGDVSVFNEVEEYPGLIYIHRVSLYEVIDTKRKVVSICSSTKNKDVMGYLQDKFYLMRNDKNA